MEPRNRFQGMNSASLCSLAGRYDNPIPTQFLSPIDCLKIPALRNPYIPPPHPFFSFSRRELKRQKRRSSLMLRSIQELFGLCRWGCRIRTLQYTTWIHPPNQQHSTHETHHTTFTRQHSPHKINYTTLPIQHSPNSSHHTTLITQHSPHNTHRTTLTTPLTHRTSFTTQHSRIYLANTRRNHSGDGEKTD